MVSIIFMNIFRKKPWFLSRLAVFETAVVKKASKPLFQGLGGGSFSPSLGNQATEIYMTVRNSSTYIHSVLLWEIRQLKSNRNSAAVI